MSTPVVLVERRLVIVSVVLMAPPRIPGSKIFFAVWGIVLLAL
jgi:hypothetical protein